MEAKLKTVTYRYATLPIPPNKCMATYIWIGGTGENVKGKTRTLDFIPKFPIELPVWNYYEGPKYQSYSDNFDSYLFPVAIFNDPFTRDNNKLVMCDTYKCDKTPTETNKRVSCLQVMNAANHVEPWFGIEQEYTLLNLDERPLGWPVHTSYAPHGPDYCAVGAKKVYGRDIMEAHYRACLYAGITIAGTKAAVPQWQYQVGPCEGISIADELWVSRYILQRVAEDFSVKVLFDQENFERDWNLNFSTDAMRQDDGITEIENIIKKLSKNNAMNIKVYDPRDGKDNEKRLTGKNEWTDIFTFSSGLANRCVSVRIPRWAPEEGCYGRPAANFDPYSFSEALVRICVFNQ